MKMPLISVIIPVYNVEEYVGICVESVLKQTYSNLEIIIIDDGSTDKSGQVVEEYKQKDKRIQVVHQKNQGLSAARNRGLQLAKGEYVQFIDSDDYIDEDMIEVLYNCIIKYNAEIAMCNHYTLQADKITKEVDEKITVFEPVEAIRELLLDKTIRNYTWEKLWKRELFNDIQFPLGKRFEDVSTTPLLFSKANKIVLYNCAKYYYRQRPGSIMNKQSNELRLEYIEAIMKVNKYLREKLPELNVYLDYNIVHATLNTWNDIAIFNMTDLIKQDKVNEIYNMTKKIMNDKEKEKIIVEKSSNIKKLHLYYLLSDKEGYVRNHTMLPELYPGYGRKIKKM